MLAGDQARALVETRLAAMALDAACESSIVDTMERALAGSSSTSRGRAEIAVTAWPEMAR